MSNKKGKSRSCNTKKPNKEKEDIIISPTLSFLPWTQEDESPDEEKFSYFWKNNNFNGLRKIGVLGLKNLTNTCFMNSSLQCLSHIKYLYELLDNFSDKSKSLCYNFAQFLNIMYKTTALKVYKPVDIFKYMCKKLPKYKSMQQQDANEFISFFLSSMHEELKSQKGNIKNFDISKEEYKKEFEFFSFYQNNSSPIIDIFYGNLLNVTKCPKGHVYDFDFSVFNMLELSIYNFKNLNKVELESLIKHYTKTNPLGINEFCPHCKVKSPSLFGIEILNAPNILIIFINKVINGIYYYNIIDFPTILDLDKILLEDKNIGRQFELIGIINHSGSASYGHYTAECKNFIDNKWYSFNDSWASELKKEKSSIFSIGGFLGSSNVQGTLERNTSDKVLLLFYQRINIKENKKNNK